MIKRIDQQLLVNRMMIDCYDSESIHNKKCRVYMRNYLSIIMTVSSIMAILSNDEENINKKAALWALLKEKEPSAYRHIRFSILGIWMNWPGKVGRKISVAGYRIVQKIFGFN